MPHDLLKSLLWTMLNEISYIINEVHPVNKKIIISHSQWAKLKDLINGVKLDWNNVKIISVTNVVKFWWKKVCRLRDFVSRNIRLFLMLLIGFLYYI